ncbi:MAG: hypothetical protein LBU86_04600 [Oscillospiraceae bacterium]|jgi:FtsH-binding integral membrane protein|nr:hypothetical protein [Oscillospiraceae bacterium]
MKKRSTTDERTAAQLRKISSEAYGLLMITLIVAMLVQQFLLNAPFEQYAGEAICFLGMSIYILVRHLTVGLDIYGGEKRAKCIPIISAIMVGIVVTAVNGISNYTQYSKHYAHDGIGYFIAVLAVTFISATVLTFILQAGLAYLNKKRQANIQKQLDRDERED